MQIRVASYLAASDLLQREPGRWDALVILDRDAELNPFVVKQTTRHCVLRFDDIERSTVGKQLVTRMCSPRRYDLRMRVTDFW